MSVRTIEHKIAAGSNFNAGAPAGDPVLSDDLESFTEGTSGGLFDFGNDNPIYIYQLIVVTGNATNLNIKLVDKDGVKATLFDGAPPAPPSDPAFISSPSNDDAISGLVILEGQQIEIVTTGGSLAMRARISVDRLRT